MANNNSSKDEIILVLPKGDAGWQAWGKISGNACGDIFALEQQTDLKGIRNNFSGILVLPLFAKEKGEIVPFGLNFIKNLRLQENNTNYTCTPLFLVPSEIDIPPVPVTSKFVSSFAKKIIKNPSFGDDLKAVFFAELIYERGSRDEKKILNLLSLVNPSKQDIKKAAKKLLCDPDLKKLPILRELFYGTFVTFYDPFGKIEKDGRFSVKWADFKNSLELKNSMDTYGGIDAYDILTLANKAYNGLNGIDQDNPHNVELELFRAPVPFQLQELVDAKNEISEELKKGDKDKKIKLLLIDNRSDNKFIFKNDTDDAPKAKSLCDLLFSEDNGFGLGDIFEIQMLGNTVYKKKGGVCGFYKYEKDTKLSNYSEFKKEYEEFDHKPFIRKENKIKIETYADLVYHKIKEAHFVLLDFFLDDDDTYLAFDFIRDMAAIKRQEGDISTTWYFITSAVYDSVVKYSQSGLLAEYYESAVVNAGDDPTNEKRQIIFIYKLLTFIQARLKSFKGFEKAFNQSNLFKENCEKSTGYCKEPHNCFYPIQSLCRKYLGEYNEIIKIFPGIEQEKTFKENVELTDNIINQFLWLPEADWPMIQRQIEHLNIRFEKEALDNSAGTGIKFCCKYILNELQERSEIY